MLSPLRTAIYLFSLKMNSYQRGILSLHLFLPHCQLPNCQYPIGSNLGLNWSPGYILISPIYGIVQVSIVLSVRVLDAMVWDSDKLTSLYLSFLTCLSRAKIGVRNIGMVSVHPDSTRYQSTFCKYMLYKCSLMIINFLSLFCFKMGPNPVDPFSSLFLLHHLRPQLQGVQAPQCSFRDTNACGKLVSLLPFSFENQGYRAPY